MAESKRKSTRDSASKASSRDSASKARSRGSASKASSRGSAKRGGAGTKKASRSDSKGAAHASSNGGSRRGMSAAEAVRAARQNIAELLGRPVEGIIDVGREHGNWTVTAQVVELERIPNTMDILGDYEAVLDKDGEIVVCRRTHRYRRSQVDEDQ